VDRMRAQFRPWPFVRAIHSHRAITPRPPTITTVMMSGLRWLSWAAVRMWPRHCRWAAAVMSLMTRVSVMIRYGEE
jgi:hypothetical protein